MLNLQQSYMFLYKYLTCLTFTDCTVVIIREVTLEYFEKIFLQNAHTHTHLALLNLSYDYSVYVFKFNKCKCE